MDVDQFKIFSESHGISLEELGVHDSAFTRIDALSAIILLQNSDLAILGGDVYARADSMIKPTYDNWYCDPNPDEQNNNYLIRTLRTASEYIENYPEPCSFEPLFVLVLSRR